MLEVVWESLYQRGIEHLTLDGTHADSVIATEQFGLRYSIDCDARWNFRRAEIVCGPRRLDIRRDGRDWRVNGQLRDDLRDCTEIDIAATPFTNTLPIRRLQVPIGEERAIAVVYIKPPELAVSRMQQRYRRIDALTWAYSGGGDYTITVDPDGLVTDYPPWFRRITPPVVWVRHRWNLPLSIPSTHVDGYTIRTAAAHERDAVLRVVLAAYASDPIWLPMMEGITRRMTRRIDETFGSNGAAYFVVADRDGAIAAVSGVAESHWTDQNLLTGICVLPPHQRHGLGAALLAESLRWLQSRGLKEARVYTERGSLADRKIYPRFGSTREEGVDYPALARA
jgi:uncharacterized protein